MNAKRTPVALYPSRRKIQLGKMGVQIDEAGVQIDEMVVQIVQTRGYRQGHHKGDSHSGFQQLFSGLFFAGCTFNNTHKLSEQVTEIVLITYLLLYQILEKKKFMASLVCSTYAHQIWNQLSWKELI